MSNCPDCGCRTDNGICSNCQEELFIMENQYEYIESPLSDGFVKKAGEQREHLKQRRN